MKWKKCFDCYLIFAFLYQIFTVLCIALNFWMREYEMGIARCWFYVTVLFLVITAVVWIVLLVKIICGRSS